MPIITCCASTFHVDFDVISFWYSQLRCRRPSKLFVDLKASALRGDFLSLFG